jgi:hypothetical protein
MGNYPPAKRTFYIGLNMAGAISAGAYSAGVMDFLIDALDTWYAAREEQRRQFGEDYWKWTIPAHDVKLVVLSGASAGGMTAAVAAAALQTEFHPVRDAQSPPTDNALYNAWVKQVDIKPLLGSQDLQNAQADVVSLLDSSIIDTIADDAMKVASRTPRLREYLADGAKVILTLTNVRGVPYTIAKNNGEGNPESTANYYADEQQFEILKGDAAPSSPGYTPLSAHTPSNWTALGTAAKATGAFPVVLAPRAIDRSAKEYNDRTFTVAKSPAECKDGICICTEQRPQKPNWSLTDDQTFRTYNIDGGVTNNSPFDCTHNELMRQPGAPADGRAARDPLYADRAVITVAPFPVEDAFDAKYQFCANPIQMALKLMDVAISQSRFQGENIHLAQLDDVFSRFIVAPTAGVKAMPALACGSLNAFGGFLAEEFRARDYQLGRRNCQQFLRKHFVLPPENDVMKTCLAEHDPERGAFLKNFGVPMPNGDGAAIPIIPLLGSLQAEIPETHAAIHQDRLAEIVPLISGRIKLVISRMLEKNLTWGMKLAFEVAWSALHGNFESWIHEKMAKELASSGLIQ